MRWGGPLSNGSAGGIEAGRAARKLKLKQCVDCPAMIQRGKRCPPCSSLHMDQQRREYRKVRKDG